MSETIEYLVVAVFNDEQSAAVAASAIKEAADEASIHVSGLASVRRDQHGHMHLHEIGDVTGSQGAVCGLAAGARIGLIFPPAVLESATKRRRSPEQCLSAMRDTPRLDQSRRAVVMT